MSSMKKYVTDMVLSMPASGIRKFFDLVSQSSAEDIISLGVGEPDYVTPWHIRKPAGIPWKGAIPCIPPIGGFWS